MGNTIDDMNSKMGKTIDNSKFPLEKIEKKLETATFGMG
jgi:hypothetical protein